LLIAGGVACVIIGYLLAQQLTSAAIERSARATEQQQRREVATLRADAERWADTGARNSAESLLRTFVAGISPEVLTRRRESVEQTAMALLRVSGVTGIHVLGSDSEILYSSGAKLTTTGDTTYRGSWALQATGFTTRESARPGIVEYAMPISNGDTPLAVAWLEYDVARARDAARPASLGGGGTPPQPNLESAPDSNVAVPKIPIEATAATEEADADATAEIAPGVAR
jgi:hypothetical protein